MINKEYLKNIPEPKTNILHNYTHDKLTNPATDLYSQNEFNNLVLNSNLDEPNIIK